MIHSSLNDYNIISLSALLSRKFLHSKILLCDTVEIIVRALLCNPNCSIAM